MILLIDNYDSFTYNLAQYFGELGAQVTVYRNDAINADEVEALTPDQIVISPGPGTPSEAGVSNELIRRLGSRIPFLGVCLGHQCIGEVYGGSIGKASRLMHGKVSLIYHYGDGLFLGIPSPFEATRYHSLVVEEPVAPDLRVNAFTKEGELMGIHHKQYPVYGLQFHPESFLTTVGKQILRNFLNLKQ